MVSKVARTSLFTAPATDSIRVVRYAGVSDSVFAWLDTFGWDSARNSPADIWTVVEVVRASDSAILWRGDTISARDLDTLGAPVNKALWVPVGDVADSGEMVYIRTRSFTSPLVSYDVSGGFTYYTDETPPLVVPKPALRYGEFGNRSRESVLSLAVVPNPMTSGRVSTLHVSSRVTGEIRVSVWDVRGKRLGELPLIEADKVGTWSVQLDLEGLKPGTYIVRAESAGELGVVQVVVQ